MCVCAEVRRSSNNAKFLPARYQFPSFREFSHPSLSSCSTTAMGKVCLNSCSLPVSVEIRRSLLGIFSESEYYIDVYFTIFQWIEDYVEEKMKTTSLSLVHIYDEDFVFITEKQTTTSSVSLVERAKSSLRMLENLFYNSLNKRTQSFLMFIHPIFTFIFFSLLNQRFSSIATLAAVASSKFHSNNQRFCSIFSFRM